MSTPNDGGPAFPVAIPEGLHRTHPAYYQKGISKREYFAAMAMQGLLASMGDHCVSADKIAEFAVGHADNLLEALSQEAAP